MNALKPPLTVLCKLGSLAVHVEEAREMAQAGNRHALVFDWGAIQSILNDAEVREWLASMDRDGFLPLKR
jgi:hypothetical protein